MRRFTLTLIAVVLTLALQGFGKNYSEDFELFGQDSLTSLPHINVDYAQSQSGKNSSKVNLIAQLKPDLSSTFSIQNRPSAASSYYLPIYSLNRKKEYFLLI
jgi:hypothetical protein